MSIPPELSGLPPWLSEAFIARGFLRPTPIQQAVLDPALRGRDLRISSATGSGKTIALSAVLGEALFPESQAPASDGAPSDGAASDGAASEGAASASAASAGEKPRAPEGPRVLVVAPTRELATQLARELHELYAPHGHRVALVLGGGSYRTETSALRARPSVLVATPGRLVDHMQRGQVNLASVAAVALDEADQLLALGFKDELDAILGACPVERRTIMSSATFSGPVRQLAKRHQRDAVRVEGTPVDQPHADIEHVGHVVRPQDQLAAITNILLAAGDDRCLVFVAMRAQVTDLAQCLGERGFPVAALSGEMSQAERSRALEAFRHGRVRTLVATDVAARGIDVDGVRWVVHASPPRDIEALIHRSGRTGRAGQRGCSVQLLTPSDVRRVQRMFGQSGLSLSLRPVPGPAAIERVYAQRWAEQLAEDPCETEGREGETTSDPLLETLLERFTSEELLVRLVKRLRGQMPCEPAIIEPVTMREPRPVARPARHMGPATGNFTLFEVSYGGRAGATPQRVMAMVCRRGNVERKHIGSIDVLDGVTRVEVASAVADAFARSATRPDARDRNVHIRRAAGGAHAGTHAGTHAGSNGSGPRPARPTHPGRPRAKSPAGPAHGKQPPRRKPAPARQHAATAR